MNARVIKTMQPRATYADGTPIMPDVAGMIAVTCLQCGKESERNASVERTRLRRGSIGPFCDRACLGSYKGTAIYKERNGPKEKVAKPARPKEVKVAVPKKRNWREDDPAWAEIKSKWEEKEKRYMKSWSDASDDETKALEAAQKLMQAIEEELKETSCL